MKSQELNRGYILSELPLTINPLFIYSYLNSFEAHKRENIYP